MDLKSAKFLVINVRLYSIAVAAMIASGSLVLFVLQILIVRSIIASVRPSKLTSFTKFSNIS